MSKKKLDISSITNELRGQSVFFPGKDEQPVPGQSGEPTENKKILSVPTVTETGKNSIFSDNSSIIFSLVQPIANGPE